MSVHFLTWEGAEPDSGGWRAKQQVWPLPRSCSPLPTPVLAPIPWILSLSSTLSLLSADLPLFHRVVWLCQALTPFCAQGLSGVERDTARRQPCGLAPNLIAEIPSFCVQIEAGLSWSGHGHRLQPPGPPMLRPPFPGPIVISLGGLGTRLW